MALQDPVHAESSHKSRTAGSPGRAVVSLLLQPHRYTSCRALEFRPAIVIRYDLLAEMSGRVIEACIGPENVHPLTAFRAVGQQHRHGTRVLRASCPHPA